jgi:hypothetical protein
MRVRHEQAKSSCSTKNNKEGKVIYTHKAAPDIEVLTSNFPIPGFGMVPINAFVI